jgi:tetratricopeptide (TPR) repeat protein
MKKKFSIHKNAWLTLTLLTLVASGCSANRFNVEGSKYYQQGQYSQAINSFQQAIKAQPRDANGYYNLGVTFHNLGNQTKNSQSLVQAESFYRQAIENNPDHVDAHRGLAVLLAETNRKQLAFDSLRDWLARRPDSAEPRIELARLYKEFGDKSTATQLLSDALNVDYRNARALRALGHIREENGDLSQAIANYERAYQIDELQKDLPGRIAYLQQRLASTYNFLPEPTRMVESRASTAR